MANNKFHLDYFNHARKEIKLPSIVNIVKGANAVSVARGDVVPGQIFAMKQKNGKLGIRYAHIGTNGRMYCVNLDTGSLTSGANRTRSVTLTGKYEYMVNRKPAPGVVRSCLRSEVRPGEVFHVLGKDTLYAHLGRVSLAREGYLSVPLARTENHAISRTGNSRVNVVGTFTLDVTQAA